MICCLCVVCVLSVCCWCVVGELCVVLLFLITPWSKHPQITNKHNTPNNLTFRATDSSRRRDGIQEPWSDHNESQENIGWLLLALAGVSSCFSDLWRDFRAHISSATAPAVQVLSAPPKDQSSGHLRVTRWNSEEYAQDKNTR